MTSPETERLIQTQVNRGELNSRFWSNTLTHGKDKLTVALLEQRKEFLSSYWSDFLNKHYVLLEKKDAAGTDYLKDDYFTQIELNYSDACANIVDLISKLRTPADSKGVIQGSSNSDNVQAQLPKIELPTFSGNLLEWESFRDQFKKLVHEIPNIPDVHKLLYLKTHLRGQAAEVIENTPVTSANYKGAWEDLERRYGSKRILSNFHMKSLFEISPIIRVTSSELKRILDHFRQTVRAFENLGKPVEEWDEWFVFLLIRKLDSSTRLAWELSLVDTSMIPTFSALFNFLENRIHALDVSRESNTFSASQTRNSQRDPVGDSKTFKQRSLVNTASTKQLPRKSFRCPLCSKGHFLNYCPEFKGLKPNERREQVLKLSLCINCLSNQHATRCCKSSSTCLACGQKHHTLLHESFVSRHQDTPTLQLNGSFSTRVNGDTASPVAASTPLASVHSAMTNKLVLLATVRLQIQSPPGKIINVRALLDTASDSSFVTEWVAQVLRLPKTVVHVPITGVQGCETGIATSLVNFYIRSMYDASFGLFVQAYVLKTLTTLTPSHSVRLQHWPHLHGLHLADPEFGKPSSIDLILGADVCGPLFLNEACLGPIGSPTARLTPFGWVLMGPAMTSTSRLGRSSVSVMHIQTQNKLTDDLQVFWEMEKVSSEKPMSDADAYCENHFRTTHSRDDEGHYVVRLPFRKDNLLCLGASRTSAMNLFMNSERRLEGKPELRAMYNQFMSEYLSMKHMEVAEQNSHDMYYLPHHAVEKGCDASKSIRVVFNASFKSSSGLSLNDLLLPGPKLQPDLWVIVTRWRFFRVAFTTDIVKMFRQIRIHPDDADYQRILWRFNPAEPVKDYKLSTVTYGTASAPFLALRVLRQLAQDEESNFPLGAEAIRYHSYVDDILCGAEDVEQALAVKEQIVCMLNAAGFPLSKWASNNSKLSPEKLEHKSFIDRDQIATLGINWEPEHDVFNLRIIHPSKDSLLTKRSVLSEIARLYDPMGWMAPVLVFAKIFIQDLWLANLTWDHCLPTSLASSWCNFRSSLFKLNSIRIPRWVQVTPGNLSEISLHGFCDASARAYAAVVYIRVSNVTQGTSVNLLVAKTKVAPVKTVSVPRLELCAAVLLTRLLVKVIAGIRLGKPPVYAWTDSKVSLAWIRGHASQWTPFVAHRVAEIQSSLDPACWNYVPTRHNPADAATRGISPDELLRSSEWWHGASWLIKEEAAWIRESWSSDGSENEELRKTRLTTCHISSSTSFGDVLLKFSCLLRLVRIISLCLRYLHNSRYSNDRRTGHITAKERADALLALIKWSQARYFGREIADLQRCRPLLRSSPLLPLKPVLDEKGVLRVGGRLQNAVLSFDEKHPMIIAKQCHLAVLLIRHAHMATLHGGQQLTRYYLARRYWILRNRVLVKKEIKCCVVCNRFRERSPTS